MANKPWDEGSMVAAGVKQIWVEFQLYVWLLLQLEASVWSLRASFFSLKKWKSWYLSPRDVLRAKWNNVCQVPRSTPWFTVADHMEYLSPFPFSLSLGVFCDFPIKRPLCLSLFCFKVKCPKPSFGVLFWQAPVQPWLLSSEDGPLVGVLFTASHRPESHYLSLEDVSPWWINSPWAILPWSIKQQSRAIVRNRLNNGWKGPTRGLACSWYSECAWTFFVETQHPSTLPPTSDLSWIYANSFLDAKVSLYIYWSYI